MPAPAQPPPFGPYRASDGSDTKENLLGYLQWVADGIWRTHEMTRQTLAYTKALYEHEHAKSQDVKANRAAGVSDFGRARGPAPVFPPTINDVLFEAGRYAIKNRAAFARFLKGFIR